VRRAAPNVPVFASGGLRTGIDIAKSIALGATLGGMAGRLLQAAADSATATSQTLEHIIQELRLTMFAAGAADLAALHRTPLVKISLSE